MKMIKHISCYATLLLAAALLLSACGSRNSGEHSGAASAGAENDSNRPEADSDASNLSGPEKLALEEYCVIVAQADTYYDYDIGSLAEPTGYQYALVQMRTGDAAPTLLLKQKTTDSPDYVRIFQYDSKSGTVRQPEDRLMEGVASAGGYRGSLAMQVDGNGILSLETSGGSGETRIIRVTLEGDALHYDVQWQGLLERMPNEPGSVGIAWYDVSDTSALDNWQNFEDPTDFLREAAQNDF